LVNRQRKAGFYFLAAVGMTSVSHSIDAIVTGLTVGAGTKPLHDLNHRHSEQKRADHRLRYEKAEMNARAEMDPVHGTETGGIRGFASLG
jgi:hypothetical protein